MDATTIPRVVRAVPPAAPRSSTECETVPHSAFRTPHSSFSPVRRFLRSRLFHLAVAVVLLLALYAAADWRAVGRILVGLDAVCLVAAFALFVPQTILSAWRWRALVRPVRAVKLATAIRHTLAASALNLVVPSKLGDLSKAAMLPALPAPSRARAALLAAIEKGADAAVLAGLMLWGATGWPTWGLLAIGTGCAMAAGVARRSASGRRTQVAATGLALTTSTLALWALHLAQIDLFLKAAGVFVPIETMLARVPVAIFAGLLPVSFCGVGTRDAALIWLFADVADTPTMAAVGLLTALRYLVPGAAGIPLLAGIAASNDR